ncbi:hypothetical protein NDU88_007190 [Pleurodeles waltl]|uniref:Uncharacterized protein n=1 Tax=Pleurodeles waltl TaxID=8319 RepID=A0AAV7RU25_PLEWA|nr:hypothetical protein NDU88_007190 [Pleurodeles waltl]
MLDGRSCQPPQGPVLLGNVMLVQGLEAVQHCDQEAVIQPLVGIDPQAPVCTPRVIRSSRQGTEDCLGLGEIGEHFYSFSDQSRDLDDTSTSSLIDSETYNSSTAPLTPTSMLRRTPIKCHEGRGEVVNLDKLMEPNEKRKKKKNARVARAMSWDYTGTQQLQHSLGDISLGPAALGLML